MASGCRLTSAVRRHQEPAMRHPAWRSRHHQEDYLIVADHCMRRGLATLAFDGPGQGETMFEMRWRTDFERAIIAVIDYLEGRPEIDRARIGIVGRSMGGF